MYYQPPYARGILTDERAMTTHAQQLVKAFDVRTPNVHVTASALSGGNQQKLIVAREFSRSPVLLIAAQPTRGIDVGSIEFIHKQIVKQRDEGAAVLVVSAELDEVLSLSDRIVVMYRGKIVASLLAEEADREQLGLLMAGASPTPVEEVDGRAG
jgi:general nucleoside transport system ATP-binding protein